MNFSIYRTNENGLELVNLKDERTGTEIALLPGHGASLHAFRVRQKDGAPFNVIDNYRDLDELEKEMGRSFKSPKLSPFPCRIAGGNYQFEGKDYQFGNIFSDGTAIHGLLYNKAFTIMEEDASDTAASLSMEYWYKKDNAGYPFDYNCLVRHVLHGDNLLEVVTTVTNLDKITIPVADGWHPYFQLGGTINDWLLQFHASAIVEFNEQLIPTGRLLQYDAFDNPRLIGDTFLDNCFVLKPGIVSPACELFNPANGLRVSFSPDGTYPYLQLYTPPSRTSIAVENLSSAPDTFNNKMGLLLLPPGHSQIFTARYKVSVE
ncbi:MAG TPA: aldose 1-epimerase [Puia sp.]|jgi:aldose 1-epimerase|nr:aldose 1-epimerase [Puia sp.]